MKLLTKRIKTVTAVCFVFLFSTALSFGVAINARDVANEVLTSKCQRISSQFQSAETKFYELLATLNAKANNFLNQPEGTPARTAAFQQYNQARSEAHRHRDNTLRPLRREYSRCLESGFQGTLNNSKPYKLPPPYNIHGRIASSGI